MLLTNIQHGHMGDGINLNTNCWQLENYVSLLFLDPRKKKCNGMGEYYGNVALDMFGGLTRDFLSFQISLDQDNDIRENKIKYSDLDENQMKALFHIYYIGDKITDLHIISEWVKTLDKIR